MSGTLKENINLKICLLFLLVLPGIFADEKINICTTTPNIASIVEAVGGTSVEVKCIVSGMESPYVLKDQKRATDLLDKADLLVVNGFGLEDKWLPQLLKKSAKKNLSPGQTGYFDPSIVIKPLVFSKGAFTRLSGRGEVKVNPHYLLDPVNAILLSQLICSRLKSISPDKAGFYNKNLAKFQGEVFQYLVGAEIAKSYSSPKLSKIIKRNQLMELIEELVELPNIKGWYGKMRDFREKNVVVDRNTYGYFLNRFRIKVIVSVELFPGKVPPVFHLQRVKKELMSGGVDYTLKTSWFNERYVEELFSVSKKVPSITLMPQTDAKRASTYIELVDFNVNKLLGLTRKTTE